MTYIPGFKGPAVPPPDAVRCVLYAGDVLVFRAQNQARFPTTADLSGVPFRLAREFFLGTLHSIPWYCADLDEIPLNLPDSAEFCGLRGLFDGLPADQFWMAGRAAQLAHWNRTHQFCGQCGHPTQDADDERAKRCPQCGHSSYPRISPAIIVAVVNDQQELLLAHAKHFPSDLYSVIAGFVEPGETLEDAVRREVKEEVNLEVTDIRYFGSQPWPFPDSLMLAFTARHAGGEIEVDAVEITDAGWYTAATLPQIPGPISVSRKLIDWFVSQSQS